jgi:hypothetical protein
MREREIQTLKTDLMKKSKLHNNSEFASNITNKLSVSDKRSKSDGLIICL